jgi:beta-lactamase class A
MARLDQVIAGARGSVAVVVLDLISGATLSAGVTGHGFVSASIAKVDILAALLLQTQDAGTHLTSWQRLLATSMIERSDNGAADTLYRQSGSDRGINTANRRMGLTHTTAHGTHWGLTTTTVADQLQLLRQVFTNHSALLAPSRDYFQSLMSRVESDQAWGVSAATDDGRFALKNGWLPRPDGSWVVNSVGRVDQHGRSLLIAALSEDNTSWAAGIHLLASAAASATAALSAH